MNSVTDRSRRASAWPGSSWSSASRVCRDQPSQSTASFGSPLAWAIVPIRPWTIASARRGSTFLGALASTS